MSGKIKRSIYPCVEQVKNLPLYLTRSAVQSIRAYKTHGGILVGSNLILCRRQRLSEIR